MSTPLIFTLAKDPITQRVLAPSCWDQNHTRCTDNKCMCLCHDATRVFAPYSNSRMKEDESA